MHPPPPPPPPAAHSLLKNFLSGGVGGMCLVLAGHPFDLVKVRLQTMTVAPGGVAPYKGALDCATKTLRAEGVRGLYKGMSAPFAGVTPIFAVCFWAYDLGKTMFKRSYGYTEDKQLSLNQIGIAGALSAVPTTAIMAPGERIKVILQVQDTQAVAGGKKFAGPMDVVKHLVRTEGVASVFRGSAATLLRDGSGSYAYFAVYEYIKRTLTPEGQSLSPTAVVVGGGFAGVCNWLVALPFDVVKSRIQTSTSAGGSTSMAAVARSLIAEGGVRALYKGAAPALLRAFPANAACFLGMETSKAAMDKLF